jgi:phosphohistidine phosphatase
MGAYLRDEGIEPDLVLCSSARRTRLTLDLLDLAVGGEVRTEDELYGADAISLLDRLRLVGDDVGSVLVIGHNPGIHDLACLLMNDSDELAAGFPTAALADLRVPVATWREVRPGIAMLHAFVVPRQLE